jgi:hypothetical protein
MSHKEYILPGFLANLYGLCFAIPVFLLAGVPYVYTWGEKPDHILSILQLNKANLQWAIDAKWWLFVLILVGVVLHELIHGICMAASAGGGWKTISFGFSTKAIAPYTHCNESLTPCAYRISLAMPGFLLGGIPILTSWFTGNILFLFFGILFCWAASGDAIILWMSRKITGGVLQDHPDQIGFVHQSR